MLAQRRINRSSTQDSSSSLLVYLDKCAVCGAPASKKCAGCSLVFYCSPEHQRMDWSTHKDDCRSYQVKDIVQDGRSSVALVANKQIPGNTLVVSEYPILTFDKGYVTDNEGLLGILQIAEVFPQKCIACDAWICDGGHRCSKCGLPLCSIKCEDAKGHLEDCKMLTTNGIKETRTGPEMQNIFEDMKILRIILNEKQKGTDLLSQTKKDGPLKTWAGLLNQAQAEAIPVEKDEGALLRKTFPLSLVATPGKGKTNQDLKLVKGILKVFKENSIPCDRTNKRKYALFDKYAYLTHSCAPNLEWWLDSSGLHLKLMVRSIGTIVPGTTLTIFRPPDSTILLNPTLLRRPKLAKVLPFQCTCKRCTSPTELSTCLSGLRCHVCKQVSNPSFTYMYPASPLARHPAWACSSPSCSASKTYEQILVITLKAEKALDAIWQAPQLPTNSAIHTSEAIISKLQDFISTHSTKILHPSHYLIMTAKSRINRVVSHFLGTGAKLFLCVVTAQPRAYDYCTYKIDHSNGFITLMTKLFGGPTRITGKIKYELVFAEAAIVLRDFHEKRISGLTFQKRLQKIMECITDCVTCLKEYSHCKGLMEEVQGFRNMLRALLGNDIMSGYRKKLMQNSKLEENSLRLKVAVAIDRWGKLCAEVDLKDLYVHPEKRDGPPGSARSGVKIGSNSNDSLITKADLNIILMDVTSGN